MCVVLIITYSNLRTSDKTSRNKVNMVFITSKINFSTDGYLIYFKQVFKFVYIM